MKEHPILFSAPMVRAILEGRKTVTRRVMKPQPKELPSLPGSRAFAYEVPGPYGQPGDRLWVRETWGIRMFQSDPPQEGWGDWHVYYAADGYHEYRHEAGTVKIDQGALGRLRQSIHMPRWASRITLEVIGVRVERLQDISCEQAIAEGVERVANGYGNGPVFRDYALREERDIAEWYSNPIDSFRSLWESINGAGSWDANPWVWVVEFSRFTA